MALDSWSAARADTAQVNRATAQRTHQLAVFAATIAAVAVFGDVIVRTLRAAFATIPR